MPREKTLFEPLTWWRLTIYALIVPAAVVALIMIQRIAAVQARHYTWQQMDWNGDGHTTIGEYLHTTQVGSRLVDQGGISCVEYFELRDRRRIRLSCPQP